MAENTDSSNFAAAVARALDYAQVVGFCALSFTMVVVFVIALSPKPPAIFDCVDATGATYIAEQRLSCDADRIVDERGYTLSTLPDGFACKKRPGSGEVRPGVCL